MAGRNPSYFRVELAQLAGCEPGLRALTCRAEAHTQDITHTALPDAMDRISHGTIRLLPLRLNVNEVAPGHTQIIS